jgi:DNA repair protein RadC
VPELVEANAREDVSRARGIPWLKVVREGTLAPRAARIREPQDVVNLLGAQAAGEETEVFWALLLDSQSQVRGAVEVSRGLLNCSLVHPREVFRLAVMYGAAVIVVHNHPSGGPTPSAEDRAVTRQLVEAGRPLDVPVYDHGILAGDRWVSFASAGLL